MTGDRAERFLNAVYAAKSAAELRALYDHWAAHYDHDVTGFGYTFPALVSALVARHVPDPGSPVLDAGCGTGLIGVILGALGYTDLHGIDLSDGMLEQARQRHLYRDLRQAVLGERLPFADDTFGAVVCAGVLTLGHAPPSSLDDLVRVTRPGGRLIFTLSGPVYEEHGFKTKIDALVSAGRVVETETTGALVALPNAPAEAALRARGHVLEVMP